jgi:uncharacterized protein
VSVYKNKQKYSIKEIRMRLEQQLNSPLFYTIKSYTPGKVTINDKVYHQSLILSAETLIEWDIRHYQDFALHHWQPILELKPEIIILGLAEQQHFLKPEWLAPIYQQKIGLECMTHQSACFTYNALMSEGRKVVMGIIFP